MVEHLPSCRAPSAENLCELKSARSTTSENVLMTFPATGEDTHGQFALIGAVARRGNVPPPHIHHRKDEIF